MTDSSSKVYQLPPKIESILSVAADDFERKGEQELKLILVNSKYKIDEGWDYDNWDGGQHGHRLRLMIPPEIFHDIIDDLPANEERICKKINQINRLDNEHISNVVMEIDDGPKNEKWREESGLLIDRSHPTPRMEEESERIWEKGYLRLFLSHLAKHKSEASDLKMALRIYGISGFVAHEDIKPSMEWQREIELALGTMDACVPLMKEGFHESKWTDQEIGFALGRSIPVIPVRMGVDPYGFIGRFQALSPSSENMISLAREIFQIFIKNEKLGSKTMDSFIYATIHSECYGDANSRVGILIELEVDPKYLKPLEVAFQENSQLTGAYTARKLMPQILNRLRVPNEQ